jgi:hypothetical protein
MHNKVDGDVSKYESLAWNALVSVHHTSDALH